MKVLCLPFMIVQISKDGHENGPVNIKFPMPIRTRIGLDTMIQKVLLPKWISLNSFVVRCSSCLFSFYRLLWSMNWISAVLCFGPWISMIFEARRVTKANIHWLMRRKVWSTDKANPVDLRHHAPLLPQRLRQLNNHQLLLLTVLIVSAFGWIDFDIDD